jgi:cytochrome b subunit of formate dehydrogenase
MAWLISMAQLLFERIVQWALLIVTFIIVLTGFGITEFCTNESATFGLLSKNLSLAIYDNLLIPFIILFVLHVAFKPVKRIYLKRRRNKHLTQINSRFSRKVKEGDYQFISVIYSNRR